VVVSQIRKPHADQFGWSKSRKLGSEEKKSENKPENHYRHRIQITPHWLTVFPFPVQAHSDHSRGLFWQGTLRTDYTPAEIVPTDGGRIHISHTLLQFPAVYAVGRLKRPRRDWGMRLPRWRQHLWWWRQRGDTGWWRHRWGIPCRWRHGGNTGRRDAIGQQASDELLWLVGCGR